MHRFWTGLVHNPSKLSSKLYQIQRENNRGRWQSSVRKILTKYGFGDVWLTGSRGEKKTFMHRSKAAVWERQLMEIHDDLNQGTGQARFYRHLSESPPRKRAVPWYLTHITDQSHVRWMTRLRLRNLNLKVTVDAWKKVSYEMRMCQACGQLDDEIHFIKDCKLFNQPRLRYISRLTQLRSAQDVVTLISSENKQVIDNLCIYIKKASKIHDEFHARRG